MTLLPLLLGCPPPDGVFVYGDEVPADVTLGDEVTCAAPVADGPSRFREEGAARGLDVARDAFWGGPTSFDGSVVAQDLDADGDVDVLLGRAQGAPDLLWNDGAGRFSYGGRPFDDATDRLPYVATTGATDLDGDALPDILLVGLGGVLVARNLGGGRFAAPEVLFRHEGAMVPLYISYALGDMDGDDDLDLALPGLDWLPPDLEARPDPAYDQRGSPVVLLENRDGAFSVAAELTPEGTPGFAMYAVFSDPDRDGDQDLLVSSVQLDFLDRIAPQALYRNDGGAWVNEAEARSVALSVSGMGGDVVDLNGDGLLDYCITDTGPVRCLVDDGAGRYYDAGTALGMVPVGHELAWQWSGWSIEVTDLDNDGALDAAISSGAEVHPRQLWAPWGSNGDAGEHPDEHYVDTLLWGDGAAFVDRGGEIGFDTAPEHFGLAAADFDGDGFRDLLTVPPEGRPELWMNRCGAGGWLEVELVGPGENREAIGAEVHVEAGGARYGQLVQALRGFGQGPSRIHVGLGDVDTVDRVTVRWTDGAVSVARDVPTRRVVTIARR